MGYLAKKKVFYYKKYKIDIWSHFKNTYQVWNFNSKSYNIIWLYTKFLQAYKDLLYIMEHYKTRYINIRLIKSNIFNNSNEEVLALNENLQRITAILTKKLNEVNGLGLKKLLTLNSRIEVFKTGKLKKSKLNKILRSIIKLKKRKRLIIEAMFKKILNERDEQVSYIKEIKEIKDAKIRSLLYINTIYAFFNISISKRESKIIDAFLPPGDLQTKSYFKKPFMYESIAYEHRRRERRNNTQFITFKFIKLFYVIYKHRQLRVIAKRAQLKSGVFAHNFLLIMECKLPSYLFRTSLFPTIFDSLEFVKTGNVWINKQFKPLTYYTVKLYDMVGFRVLYKTYIYWSYVKRLKRKAFAFMLSRCIYFSFSFLITILISRFTESDLVNPSCVDYYRIVNYIE